MKWISWAVISMVWLTEVNASDSPNIIIVLADDLGWGDPQCYQPDSKILTPAMDRLAREGLRFTDAHTPSSVCTPTRYSLLTGRYAWRTRLKSGVLDGFDPPLIAKEEDTLASLLKRAGYSTHCVGKWHLGLEWTRKDGSTVEDRDISKGFRAGDDVDFTKSFRGGPVDVGFDSWVGISASLDMSPYCFVIDDRVETIPSVPSPENRDGMFMNQVRGVMTDDFKLEEVLPRLGREAVKVIHDQAESDEPFFLYLPLTSPHLPVVLTDEMKGKSGAGEYADFVMATDDVLNEVLTALDESNQAENTLVLMTSDNGGLFHWWDFRASDDGGKAPVTKRGEFHREHNHQSNADWRGTKADIYEGGHRVPFLIRWPAVAEAGRVIEDTVELTDMLATVAELVGETPEGESGMDSFSMAKLIRGEGESIRPFAVHHSLRGTFAIRAGEWKLIEGRGSGGFTHPRTIEDDGPPGQLYSLKEDPQETINRYDDHPEVVKRLLGVLQKAKSEGVAEKSGR